MKMKKVCCRLRHHWRFYSRVGWCHRRSPGIWGVAGSFVLDLKRAEEADYYSHQPFFLQINTLTDKPEILTVKGAFVWSRRRSVVSVVIGGWSANGRGCGAAGTRHWRGHGGGLKGAAVERSRLEGTTRGALALRECGRGSLQHKQWTGVQT